MLSRKGVLMVRKLFHFGVGTLCLLASLALAVDRTQKAAAADGFATSCLADAPCVSASPSDIASHRLLQAANATVGSLRSATVEQPAVLMVAGEQAAARPQGDEAASLEAEDAGSRYPAIVLLAIAIISMAALSRRDQSVVPNHEP